MKRSIALTTTGSRGDVQPMLASAVSECVINMDMQEKARQLAASLGNSTGVEHAVAYIESVLKTVNS